MTAMNIIKRPHEIILITDGAHYSAEGRLLGVAPKVELLPHFSGFVMQSGGSAWSPAIAAMFANITHSTDDLFLKAALLLPEIVAKFAGISKEPMGRVTFGGWSESRLEMRLGAVYSAEAANLEQPVAGGNDRVIRPDAFTLHEFEGDQLLTQPPVSDRDWIDGFGSLVYDLGQITDVEKYASFVLAAQRSVASREASAEPHRGVGAFGQITRISKTESSVRIFERYDDVRGEIMRPVPVDWAAWRARRAASPAVDFTGLSRLQRERMEKKARKGTLR